MALIPPAFLDASVAIGIDTNQGIRWVGSGFLYGRVVDMSVPEDERQVRILLVTNKHVLVPHTSVKLRLNHVDDGAAPENFTVPLKDEKGNDSWVGHSDTNVDVGVIQLSATMMEEKGIQFGYYREDMNVATIEDLRAAGVSEGDGVFVVGFPLGLVDLELITPILRQGAIARIRGVLSGNQSEYLIDAPVFPGNSGSPVILRPESTYISGTQPQRNARLIGMVKSVISVSNTATTQDGANIPIVFQDNVNLANVIPMDFIVETVDEHDLKHGL